MQAKIYRPAKNAMQSGRGKTKDWLLEYVADNARFIESVMGWTGSRDTRRQLRMSFPTREAAEAYAKKKRLNYIVIEPQQPKSVIQAYADNFTRKR